MPVAACRSLQVSGPQWRDWVITQTPQIAAGGGVTLIFLRCKACASKCFWNIYVCLYVALLQGSELCHLSLRQPTTGEYHGRHLPQPLLRYGKAEVSSPS